MAMNLMRRLNAVYRRLLYAVLRKVSCTIYSGRYPHYLIRYGYWRRRHHFKTKFQLFTGVHFEKRILVDIVPASERNLVPGSRTMHRSMTART